jgi:cytochrome c-type biogenesis protein CcmH/NrfG
VRRSPDNWLGYSLRGDFHMAHGDFQRALADYDAALKLSPNNAIVTQARTNAVKALQDKQTRKP